MYCLSQFCCTCLRSDASLQLLDRNAEGSKIFNVIVKILPKIVLDRVLFICDNCVNHFRYVDDFLNMCMKNNRLLVKYVEKLDPTGDAGDARVEMVDFKVDIKKEVKTSTDGPEFFALVGNFEDFDEREDKVIVHDDFSEVYGKIKSEFSDCSPRNCDDITNNLTPKDFNEKALYSCTICGKHFNRLTKLHFHEKTHTYIEKIKSNTCMICQKNFHCPSYLHTHYLVHTGERPFKCKKCKKRYISKKDLKRHFIIHSGKKPFQCKTCGKKFAKFFQLNKHRKEHQEDAKTLENFPNTENRKTVIRSVGNPTQCKIIKVKHEVNLRCEDCDRTFRTRSSLLHHYRMHKKENPYKCSVCNKYFSNRQTLWKHHKRFV